MINRLIYVELFEFNHLWKERLKAFLAADPRDTSFAVPNHSDHMPMPCASVRRTCTEAKETVNSKHRTLHSGFPEYTPCPHIS
jgi:hypothetical protein